MHLTLSAVTAATAAIAIIIVVAAAATTTRLALLPARRAAGRLVGETLLRVKLLLTAGENEIHSAITTRDRFVCVTQRSHAP